MELKQLRIHGFKSFADKVELSFEHGITGVVGPNGCGKSNISDAVRWVLGEQSARSLRGIRMEDVIFGGTEKRRKQAFCEVTLVFDNTDRSLPIEFSEVAITRRVYRNGSGEYYINGNACRLRDLIDLFRDTGIGRDGYSIIGQGRIDEILSQKSEDRRQVFEEAAGIMKFRARKQESENRLAASMANMERVDDILSELTERLEPLREQSETAREYLALRDELKVLELNDLLARSVRYESRIAELRALLMEAEQRAAERAGEITDLTSRRDTLREELDLLEEETRSDREELQQLIRTVEAGEGSVGLLREKLRRDGIERDRLEKQRLTAQGGSKGIRDRILELTERIGSDQEALGREQSELAAKEQELAGKESRLAEEEQAAEDMKAEIIRSMNRLGDVRSQQARLSAMLTAIGTQLERLALQEEQEAEGTRSLNDHVSELRDRLEAEQQRREELAQRIEEIEQKVRSCADRIRTEADHAEGIREEVRQTASRLRLLREMQQDYEGMSNPVRQVLLRAQRQGGSGICGVVADLIRVPESYERAVDMVLGGQIQNIVVERDEDAKRMIDFLRANRYGRATFLPIGSIRGRTLTQAERAVLSMPGCIGIASELVDFDPKYRGVMESLLGRTVIAEDLERGIAIQRAGHYAFRLVTLQGDVMHSGGSMTGGSVQSRTTNLLSRGREIEENAARLAQAEEELKQANASMETLDRQRISLKAERGEAYDAIHAQEVACARAEESLHAAEEEYKALLERNRNAQAERERLTAQKAETEARLSGLSTDTDQEKQDTEEKQRRVRELQDRIYADRTEMDSARAVVGEARLKAATDEHDLMTLRRELQGLNDRKEDTETLLKQTEEELEVCSREMSEHAAALEKEIADLADAKDELTRKREAYAEKDGARTGKQKDLNELSKALDELRGSGEKDAEARHRTELTLQKNENDYKQITDHVWEEYQLTLAGAEPFRDPEFRLTEGERRIGQIRLRIREMGLVNVGAVDEYRQTEERVKELTGEREDIGKAADDLRRVIAELESGMQAQFREQLAVIDTNFKHTFSRLFGGGTAELRLEDPRDALNCGIEIVAQPPGKKLQSLSLLSGGERALTAIAILFAMLEVRPTPFCILDEIEAALDDANIDNFAEYLKSYSEKTQFVVITHRKGTMERCGSLYGVVMEEKGISKVVSVALNDAKVGGN